MSKICNKCHVEKPLTEFYKDTSLKCGYRGQCKLCVNPGTGANSTISLTSIRTCNTCNLIKPITEYHKGKRNPGGFCSECKQCSHHRQKLSKQVRRSLTSTVRCKQLTSDNNTMTKNTKYVVRTLEERKQLRNKRRRERYKSNIHFRMSVVLRQRAKNAILGRHKKTSALKLVGCTLQFLKNWIEYQFTEGMTWDNFGEWQLDHVKPCAMFDLSDISNQLECFNWKNVRPMWAKENAKKSDAINKSLIEMHLIKANQYEATLNTPKGVEGSTTSLSSLQPARPWQTDHEWVPA